jgi:hypothetical protein
MNKKPKPTPARLVRSIITLLGTPRTMFSDRIQNGRSLKVWGWDDTLYTEASNVLARHGYRVRRVRTSWGSTRLHVFEK